MFWNPMKLGFIWDIILYMYLSTLQQLGFIIEIPYWPLKNLYDSSNKPIFERQWCFQLMYLFAAATMEDYSIEHVKSPHEPKDNLCNICENVFKSEKCLNVHIKDMHKNSEKLIGCKSCDKKFKNPTKCKDFYQKDCLNVAFKDSFSFCDKKFWFENVTTTIYGP